MPIAKNITYENLPEKNKKDPKILPFKYLKPFKQEMEEIEEEGDHARIYKDGILGVASARGSREYLMMMLSKYYSPRDLYYKTISELDQMLQMHLTESGGLI